jgi:hypothetical protein
MSQGGLNVCGLMTLPRYEGSWARTRIQIAFANAGIPLQVNFGVFYGHCMQRLFEDAIARGADVVITVDGDSVVSADQIRRLISLVAMRPGIDAIAAIQAKRGSQILLGYRQDNAEVGSDPVPVELAHFGLTAIDVRKLVSVPKPWFWSQPSPDGTWGDDRIDDDIWFWKQWTKAGNTVFIDPQTCIGHVEEMIATVDPKTFEIVHCYPDDWQVG